MATIATLIVTQPDGDVVPHSGVEVPYRGVHPNPELFGPWRFVVEVAAVDPSTSQWSSAEWGPDDDTGDAVWEDDDVGFDWVDITADVRGLEWTRGADEPYGRTRTGTATLELDNSTNRYSPWSLDPSSPFVATQQVLGPGTIIRWGYRRSFPTDETFQQLTWRPLFCGIVEWWDTESVGAADRWAEIPLVETVAALANIDEPERTPVGLWESCQDRLNRLIAPAETGWPFGNVDVRAGVDIGFYLQATTMAGNRLTECLLTVDSMQVFESTEFRSDRQGRPTWGYIGSPQLLRWDDRLSMGDGGFQTKIAVFAADDALDVDQAAVVPPGRSPVVATYSPPDALRRRATHDNVINFVSLANSGGTAVVTEDTTSRSLYGRRTFQRHDLIGDPVESPPTAWANRIIVERANPHPEVQPFTVYADTSPGTWDVLTVTDAQENAVVFGDTPSVALLCRVRTVVHRIVPDPAGLLHEADYTLDVIAELEEN